MKRDEYNRVYWENPWSDCDNFIDLGSHAQGYTDKPTEYYDLYVLVSDNELNFGARYGNEGHEYISGTAFWSTPKKEWVIYGDKFTYLAMARYLFNYKVDLRD